MIVLSVPALATTGQVTVPLSVFQNLVPPAPVVAPGEAQPIVRSVVGRIDRGVFVGSVRTTFEVLGDTPVEVGLARDGVPLVSVTLDGRPVTVGAVDGWTTVRAGPGRHEAVVELVQGQDTDRFSRELELDLPPGPPTSFQVLVPEQPIEATLADGVLTGSVPEAGGTRIEGWLDATGELALTWERSLQHTAAPEDASLEGRVDAVVEVDRDVIVGEARYAIDVRSGAIDQVRLRLPPSVEVLEVTGPAVLQWRTLADNGGELQVLLRRVIEDHVLVGVKYQYPADSTGAIVFPSPTFPLSGVVGVEAPVALELAVGAVERGRVLDPRDVPPSVLELTPDPLAVVVAFEEVPKIAVTTTPRPPVSSSTTQIDDLQGITVLVDDGTEVGKVRLTVRNTSRQVLTVDLPEGAHLTHCFRDGLPLRPAADPDRPERTIIPLLRSERSAATVHVVGAGDTLSAISLSYRGDPGAWREIAAANPGVDPNRLQAGMTLQIPADTGNEERSFVLELGWERQTRALGPVGRRVVALPTLDLPVMSADWHVYLPDRVEPLWLSTAMDPADDRPSAVSRILDSLVSAAGPRPAFAGDISYDNVLTSRRSKWEAKQERHELGTDPFPLVGRRHAFAGKLLGTDPPRLAVTYVAGGVASALRVGVMVGVAAALAAAIRTPRHWAAWAGVAGAIALGLWLGVPLVGTWKWLLWGVDLGLLVGLVFRPVRAPALFEVGAVGVLLVALCGSASSSFTALLLLPLLAVAHWRSR